jgi:hypothetical protein
MALLLPPGWRGAKEQKKLESLREREREREREMTKETASQGDTRVAKTAPKSKLLCAAGKTTLFQSDLHSAFSLATLSIWLKRNFKMTKNMCLYGFLVATYFYSIFKNIARFLYWVLARSQKM